MKCFSHTGISIVGLTQCWTLNSKPNFRVSFSKPNYFLASEGICHHFPLHPRKKRQIKNVTLRRETDAPSEKQGISPSIAEKRFTK